ncbi:MAG TPA: 23S rRNA (pseudouridine(1915)-N(3))-methyltransferase RlmH [Rickettsiales bacterium]|nr:23S rRNA (pseudouridine(1915)-N(3))-methyltransferase RlmH [Rickettsiales bacterium]
MKINILSIGKFKDVNCENLFLEYKKRTNFDVNLKELVLKKNFVGEKLKQEEGKLLLQNVNNGSKIIVLDERGKIITTNEFCELITKYQNNSVGEVSFIIGGSDGLSQEVRDKADFVLSFGKMVFPHLFVRVMLVEQLYRVYTLQNGHPYHK